MIKQLLLSILLCFAAMGCYGQIAENIVGTGIIYKCHNDGSGTLTSFIEVQVTEVGNPTPVVLGRFLPDNTPFNPTAGTISFGACTTDNNCLVDNIPDHDDIVATDKTYPANSFHTLTFTVIEGTATATINGKETTYPTFFTETYEAPNNCSYVAAPIEIDATNGKVKVAIIK